jgi:prepilin-type N-terminal cleavage/methylation domain-containing protein
MGINHGRTMTDDHETNHPQGEDMRGIAPTGAGRQSGFTLIEILVVILILGILAGIAVFGAQAFRDSARDACSTSNGRMEHTAGVIFDIDTYEGLYDREPGDCDALGDGGGAEPPASPYSPLSVGAHGTQHVQWQAFTGGSL